MFHQTFEHESKKTFFAFLKNSFMFKNTWPVGCSLAETPWCLALVSHAVCCPGLAGVVVFCLVLVSHVVVLPGPGWRGVVSP